MKNIFDLIKSSTAKDTLILFVGNASSAFLGFLFFWLLAREFSVSDLGIFTAASNFVIIIVSLTDLGISTGSINFVASSISRGKISLSKKYIKAASLLRLGITSFVGLLVILLAKYISPNFFDTNDSLVAVLVGLVSISFALPMIFPSILQAKKKFLASIIADNSLYLVRLVVALIFMYLFGITINNSLFSFVVGGLVGAIIGFLFIGSNFIKTKPKLITYKKLLKFSGWIGVNRIISAVSGRLDVQMLTIMAGATATGLYSIPSRLSGFVVVLTSSFSGVLAPRLAGFNDKEKEKEYIKKATLALIPIIAGLILWIIIAKPFITILFGNKYLESVPIFQALTIAMIPFVFTAPSVSAIIYSIKKTIFIGVYSFFQLAAIFLLNFYFIPRFGVYGPTITFGITNMTLALYTWVIVIRHYWVNK